MHIPSYLSGAVFMKAYRVLRLNVVACLSKYDLSPTLWALLGILHQSKDGIRLSEVASTLNVKAPLVTNMAHDLLAKGYIQRIPHPTDKRAKLLILTAPGRQFIKKVEVDMERTLTILLNGTTADDLASYKKVLDTIIRNSTI